MCVCVYYVFQSIIFHCYCFFLFGIMCASNVRKGKWDGRRKGRSMKNDDLLKALHYNAGNYNEHENENWKYFSFCKTKQSLAFMDLFIFSLFLLLSFSVHVLSLSISRFLRKFIDYTTCKKILVYKKKILRKKCEINKKRNRIPWGHYLLDGHWNINIFWIRKWERGKRGKGMR